MLTNIIVYILHNLISMSVESLKAVACNNVYDPAVVCIDSDIVSIQFNRFMRPHLPTLLCDLTKIKYTNTHSIAHRV